MRLNKYELRISILFIFRHFFMLPFSPFPILLITLNTCLSLTLKFFFYLLLMAVRGIFSLDKLQEFFWGDCHLTSGYNLMVRPLVLTKSRSLGRPRLRI